MRRLGLVLLIVLFVTGSATGVHASTDCERWFTNYKSELARSATLKRIEAAKARAKRYAQRKLAGYVPKPKPVTKPLAAHQHRKPRMNSEEMLRHFDLACGILPEDPIDLPLLAEDIPPDFISQLPMDDMPDDTGQQLALNDTPQYPLTGNNYSPNYPPLGGGGPFFGFGGGGGIPSITLPGSGGSGGSTPPGSPGGPGGPHTPPPPPPPSTPPPSTPPPSLPPPTPPPVVAPVPEPGSLVLLLTGAMGAAGVVRRRFKA